MIWPVLGRKKQSMCARAGERAGDRRWNGDNGQNMIGASFTCHEGVYGNSDNRKPQGASQRPSFKRRRKGKDNVVDLTLQH